MQTLSVENVFHTIQPEVFFRGHTETFHSISDHSSKAGTGVLFFACEGLTHAPEKFLDVVFLKNTPAVVTPTHTAMQTQAAFPHVTFFGVPNVRLALSRVASYLYPARPAFMAAVTGTNGKTSITHYARQIWERLNIKAASVGTLGICSKFLPICKKESSNLTTPLPLTLYPLLDKLAKDDFKACAIEASSHGLAQHRLDGLKFQAGVFCSFSHDHLDYHTNEQTYFSAKLRLFKALMAPDGLAIINADMQEAHKILESCRQQKVPVWCYGFQDNIEAQIKDIQPSPHTHAQQVDMSLFGQNRRIHITVTGRVAIENIIAAMLLVHKSGYAIEDICETLPHLAPPEGRLMCVGRAANGAHVYVDYAHTPDALKRSLEDLRTYTKGRLGVVFGCGGQRDEDKRPLMGAVAEIHADFAIVTDDNPRHEDPATIRQAILQKLPSGQEVASRAEAIRTGIHSLGPEDILLIAGKGHETVQHAAGLCVPFSDIRFAQKVLKESAAQSKKTS